MKTNDNILRLFFEWIEHRGISDRDASQQLGLSHGSVNNWRRGITPSRRNVIAMARIMGLSRNIVGEQE